MQRHRWLACLCLFGCTGELEAEAELEEAPAAVSPIETLDQSGVIDVDAAELEWLAALDTYARELDQRALERHAFFAGNGLAEEAFAHSIDAELARAGVDGVLVIEKTIEGHNRVLHVETAMAPPGAAPAATCGAIVARAVDDLPCAYVVARALEAAEDLAIRRVAAAPIPTEVLESALRASAVEDAYLAAIDVGLRSTSIDAEIALRDARVCDRSLPPAAIPEDRVLEVARDAMERAVTAQRDRTPDTECDYEGAIAEPALREVRSQIPTLRQQAEPCPGFEPPDARAAVAYARVGDVIDDALPRAIEAAYATELTRLAQTWVCAPPPPPPPPVHVAPPPMMRAPVVPGAAPPRTPSMPAATPRPPVRPATIDGGDPYAVYPVYEVCIPTGCGSCVKLDPAARPASYRCIASPSWPAVTGGLPCPGYDSIPLWYDENRLTTQYAPPTRTFVVPSFSRY